MSTTARRLRPTRREISWVRPPILPLTDSRSIRSLVERGSIAYSAVTQPLPLPVIQRGTPLVNDAVHSTLVRPNEISARALGLLAPAALDGDGAQLVEGAAVGAELHGGRMSVMRCPLLSLAFGCRSGSWMAPVCTSSTVGHLGAEEPAGQARELGPGFRRSPRRCSSAARTTVRCRRVLDQRAVHVVRGLLGARDERDLPAHHVLDRGRHQRVVGAAEHERVDVRCPCSGGRYSSATANSSGPAVTPASTNSTNRGQASGNSSQIGCGGERVLVRPRLDGARRCRSRRRGCCVVCRTAARTAGWITSTTGMP